MMNIKSLFIYFLLLLLSVVSVAQSNYTGTSPEVAFSGQGDYYLHLSSVKQNPTSDATLTIHFKGGHDRGKYTYACGSYCCGGKTLTGSCREWCTRYCTGYKKGFSAFYNEAGTQLQKVQNTKSCYTTYTQVLLVTIPKADLETFIKDGSFSLRHYVSYGGASCDNKVYFTLNYSYNNLPTFLEGMAQRIQLCSSGTFLLNNNLKVKDLEMNQTLTWSVLSQPANGVLSGFSASEATNGSTVTPTGLSYAANTGYAGVDSFQVQVSDGLATAVATLAVTVNPLPLVTASATDNTICSGESVILTGGGASSYTWDQNVVDGQQFTPHGSALYTVTGTDENGCTASASVNVTVNDNPIVTHSVVADVCVTSGGLALTGGSPVGGIYSGPGVSNGIFTPLLAGEGSHTLSYTYTNLNGCSSSSSFTVNVTPCGPSSKLRTQYCGITLNQMDDAIACDAVSGATDYEWKFTNVATGQTFSRQKGNRYSVFYLTYIPALEYNTTYDVQVRPMVNGIWGIFGATCQLTTPAFPTSKLTVDYCGINLTNLSTLLYAESIANASAWQFEITDNESGTVYLYNKTNKYPCFYFNEVKGLTYDKSYSVRVKAYVGSSWGEWGAACIVTTYRSSARISNVQSSPAAVTSEPATSVERTIAEGTIADDQASREAGVLKHVELTVFPNPAVDFINVNFDDSEVTEAGFVLLDLMGRQVLEVQGVSTGNNRINVSNLSTGSYMLLLISEEKVVATARVIKN